MKSKIAIISAVFFVLSVLSFAAAAANSKNVTFYDNVKIGNTVLKAGDYKVTWDGNGPSATVNFQQGKKTLATAPAAVQTSHTSQQDSVQLGGENKDGQMLLKITFKNVTLDFSQSGGTNSGSF